MARNAGNILTQNVMELLEKEPDGLEFAEILEQLSQIQDVGSERGLRSLINRLAKEGKLIKRKGWSRKPGAQPYVYCHPATQPRQLEIPGVKKYEICTKTKFEFDELDPAEKKREQTAISVLKSIASNHLYQERYVARAIIEVASELAEKNPVDLVVEMARWVVNDLNRLADEIEYKLKRGATEDAKTVNLKLDSQLGWAKRYFQEFWQLHARVDELPGIMELPSQAKYFRLYGQRARLDEEKARNQLEKRIFGGRLIEERLLPTDLHKAAAGTDASVADLYLDHAPGSFIPPDPVVVTSSAAALIFNSQNGLPQEEYQDFDIFPERLSDYDDHTAAVKGLVLSPTLLREDHMDEGNLPHSRKAAMDLRQYSQDYKIVQGGANWKRLIGDSTNYKPPLIIRDGRVFPSVHRLRDYERGGLYGQIVRNEIDAFQQVFTSTLLGSGLDIVYGAAVKNPGMSWLAPLVFWYLHYKKFSLDDLEVVKEPKNVYQYSLADPAVSHLLFLGLAKKSKIFVPQRLFITCRVMRRFSDIALEAEEMPPVISTTDDEIRLVDENSTKDWKKFIEQRLAKKKKQHLHNTLDIDDYRSFIYLFSNVGVSMCYAAPTSVYKDLYDSDSAGHFLLPRLEVAINTERLEQDKEHERECMDGLLSWLAAGHIDLDRCHTQSGFDTGNQESSLPILVPDVIVHAHEAATFARSRLGEEVQDRIRELIAELRKRLGKRY
ncbi:MAG: hypothetical protein MUE44_36575 [Oscillatoriaceae cyanobacterium Prado104]|jgi:hypothetical protein|nr:hypothetical protein [Oscillatoriaceae cyanobacterium Prado104]